MIKPGSKRYVYEDTEHLSQSVPGAGFHNPHDSVDKIKVDKRDYKYWTEKHKKLSEILTKRDSIKPAAGTYSPLYQSYRSFEKLEKTPKK